MHEKRVGRAYRIELWTAIAVYVALVVASIRFGRPMEDGLLRTEADQHRPEQRQAGEECGSGPHESRRCS